MSLKLIYVLFFLVSFVCLLAGMELINTNNILLGLFCCGLGWVLCFPANQILIWYFEDTEKVEGD